MSAIDKAFEFIAIRENKPLYEAIDKAFKTSGVFNPLKLKDVDQSSLIILLIVKQARYLY